jgi:hypothetical protein
LCTCSLPNRKPISNFPHILAIASSLALIPIPHDFPTIEVIYSLFCETCLPVWRFYSLANSLLGLPFPGGALGLLWLGACYLYQTWFLWELTISLACFLQEASGGKGKKSNAKGGLRTSPNTGPYCRDLALDALEGDASFGSSSSPVRGPGGWSFRLPLLVYAFHISSPKQVAQQAVSRPGRVGNIVWYSGPLFNLPHVLSTNPHPIIYTHALSHAQRISASNASCQSDDSPPGLHFFTLSCCGLASVAFCCCSHYPCPRSSPSPPSPPRPHEPSSIQPSLVNSKYPYNIALHPAAKP